MPFSPTPGGVITFSYPWLSVYPFCQSARDYVPPADIASRYHLLQVRSEQSATWKTLRRAAQFSLDHSRPGHSRPFRVGLSCFCFPTYLGTMDVSGIRRPVTENHGLLIFAAFTCKTT